MYRKLIYGISAITHVTQRLVAIITRQLRAISFRECYRRRIKITRLIASRARGVTNERNYFVQEVSDLSVIGWLQRNFDCVKDVNGESSPLRRGEERGTGCCRTPVIAPRRYARYATMQKSLMRDLYLRKDTPGNREFSARDAVQPRCLCNVKDLDNEDRYVAEISSRVYT